MNKNIYKYLFFVSLIGNIVLLALLFKPLPKEEEEFLNFFRETKESSEYVISESESDEIEEVSNQIIVNISEDWDLDTFKTYFSEEDFNQIGEEKLKMILAMYSRLGKFKEQLYPRSIETLPGQLNGRLYASNIKFEAGDAYVRLFLEKVENDWRLKRININSEVFLK